MANYGDADYWNKRYNEDADSPFDWLFSYDDVKDIIGYLIPDKSTKLLVVGSGNAPFSPDLYRLGGYEKIINIDLSPVVINQQSLKFPQQEWIAMDVCNMEFDDGTFFSVLDKSLIDTLLCCKASNNRTEDMIQEIYRVLAPGGRFITFSLHDIGEIRGKYDTSKFNWRVSAFRVKSTRWNEQEHRRRAVVHSMIVCDKPTDEGTLCGGDLPNAIPGTINDEDYLELKAYAEKVNFGAALKNARVEDLRTLLFHIIGTSRNKNYENGYLDEVVDHTDVHYLRKQLFDMLYSFQGAI